MESYMKSIQISSNIIPIAEFKTHASAILDNVKSNHQTVIITKNGKAAGVVISPEDFDRWVERDNFLNSIEQGLKDSELGNIMSDNDFTIKLESEFGKLE